MTSRRVKVSACELCASNPPACWCEDCEQALCDGCKRRHLKSKACRRHVISDLKQPLKHGIPPELMMKLQDKIAYQRHQLTTCRDALTLLSQREQSAIDVIDSKEELIKQQVETHFQALRQQTRAAFWENRAVYESKELALGDDVTEMELKLCEMDNLADGDSEHLAVITDYIESLKVEDPVPLIEPEVELVQDTGWQVARCAQLKMNFTNERNQLPLEEPSRSEVRP